MIINSLLDTDLYKYTMMQVVYHHFPEIEVEYELICRSSSIDFSPHKERIKSELKSLCELKHQPEEIDFLRSLGYFKEDFLKFLETFQLDYDHFIFDEKAGFQISIKGTWLNTILFEVPVLAIISEIYHTGLIDPKRAEAEGLKRLQKKVDYLKGQPLSSHVKFVDFGTRRRFSKHWHEQVIHHMKDQLPDNFTGTSNLLIAHRYQLPPVGTMAHEFLQACQQIAPTLETSQEFALYKWVEEYGNQLAIALSDVYNRYVFINDLDKTLRQRFQGFRQDSGDPFGWGDLMIAFLEKHDIDPKDKKLVFSDRLNFEKMLDITQYFHGRAQTVYGIGTYLTNDIGIKPVDIVIKMVKCNHRPVGKLTDDPNKTVCPDKTFLETLKTTFGYDRDVRSDDKTVT